MHASFTWNCVENTKFDLCIAFVSHVFIDSDIINILFFYG